MIRFVITFLTILVVSAVAGWTALAIHFTMPDLARLRDVGIGLVAVLWLVQIVALVRRKRRMQVLLLGQIIFLPTLAWFLSLSPSQNRNWQSDVAVLPWASFDGDLVTVHNIRNFEYRSETDFTPRYYDKTFDLRKLESGDLFATYWMGPHIAHTFLSFGFGEQGQLALSVETRKEVGETYSTVSGFFKQFEITYVVGDERDLVYLRTTHRKVQPEDVYLIPLVTEPEGRRRLFVEFMHAINRLRDQPQFYNALTTNCTTSLSTHSQVNPNHIPFSWKIIVSGHVPEYLYEQKRVRWKGTFPELMKFAHINEVATAAGTAENFSMQIRKPLRDSGQITE